MLRSFLAIGFSAAAALFAQSNTATIVSTVTDASGAIIAGARVTALNVNTQAARTAVSNAAGDFEIPLLPPGSYSVNTESAGFKRLERSGVRLDAGQKAKIDFRLEVGEVAERVEVNAAAPLLSTQTTERGVVIGAGQIDLLPLNGRGFAQLITLEPGVQVSGQIGGAVTFNGLPYQGTTI